MTDIFLFCRMSLVACQRFFEALARKLLYSSRFAVRSFGESVNRQIGESIYQ